MLKKFNREDIAILCSGGLGLGGIKSLGSREVGLVFSEWRYQSE
jgi:hypothetical protein